jgi:glycosyltransferase involved in cell wall biosynthesis
MNLVSIVVPCRDEEAGLRSLLPRLRTSCPDAEMIVVDDGSVDASARVAAAEGARVLSRPYSQGNGAAVKAGARVACGEILVLIDGDGQHEPEDIPRLVEELERGYDMVVGARTRKSQASVGRRWGNGFYNWLAGMVVGHRVEDLTSGFRVVRAEKFRQFLYLLPNGFSYPTTITMAFFRNGYPVGYLPIRARAREGQSHIRPMRDGVRFLLIIFRVATLYSPIKVFLPVSLSSFFLGLGYYLYTFTLHGRFTNMSALLLITAVLIFLIGLVSEQITTLLYSGQGNRPGMIVPSSSSNPLSCCGRGPNGLRD